MMRLSLCPIPIEPVNNRFLIMNYRTFVIYSLAALLLGGASSQAWAGQWVVDHYLKDSVTMEERVQVGVSGRMLDSSSSLKSIGHLVVDDQGTHSTLNGVAQPPDFEDGYSQPPIALSWGSGRTYVDAPLKTGTPPRTVKGTLTIQAVLKWQRNTVYDPQTDTSSPDPNDNPPKHCWVVEHPTITGSESTNQWDGNALSAASKPYLGREYTFSGIVHPFGLSYDPANSTHNPDELGGSFALDDRQITPFKVSGDWAYGRVRTFKGTITLANYPFDACYDRVAFSNLNFNYDVQPVTLAMLSRLKVDHIPSDLYADYNLTHENGSYGPLTSSATIEAGHKVTAVHDHEADLALAVLEPDGWGGLQGVPSARMPWLPALKADNREGIEKHFSLFDSDAPRLDRLDGSGRIAMATGLSRDLTSNPATVSVHTKAVGTPASIGEIWANVEWKMGQNGERAWDTKFLCDDTEYTDWLWTKLTGLNGEPLVGHDLKFLVKKLIVDVTDPTTHQTRIKFFTRDASEAQAHANDANTDMLTDADLPNYITLPAGGTSDSLGVFKGQFTVKNSDIVSVRMFDFLIEDQNVYSN